MTDAQMAFLAERRKAKVRDLSAQPGPSSSSSSQAVAPPEGAGNGSTKYSGYGAFLHDDDDDVNAPMVSQLRVQDCWKCLAGSGLVGDILVCRHVEFGTTIELVKEGSGGFTMQRVQGAQVKYCSRCAACRTKIGRLRHCLWSECARARAQSWDRASMAEVGGRGSCGQTEWSSQLL